MQKMCLICDSLHTKGWNLGQTINHAIILYDSMPADCLINVVKRETWMIQKLRFCRKKSNLKRSSSRFIEGHSRCQKLEKILHARREVETSFLIIGSLESQKKPSNKTKTKIDKHLFLFW